MKKLFLLLFCVPLFVKAQFVTQGICYRSGNTFVLNGTSQDPYSGRFFCTTPVNLNNDFDLKFNAYLGSIYNNGMAFLFMPKATPPTATDPPTVINTDNIHNFGTGNISNDLVIEFDIRGSFCSSGQNTSYEPTSDINHISYWRWNSACNFGNYYSAYTGIGTINYYAYEPYRIRWTKSNNTLETYYNNVLVKSNTIDLVGTFGSSVYWGFSSSCYCVPGGPAVNGMILNSVNVLPISLTRFVAEKNNGSVKLSWTTDHEQNSAYFIVEKSMDGINFSLMQRIAAAGNSSTLKNYSATDNEPVYGTNFYRLKMVDTDGKSVYGNTAAIKMNATGTAISLFPNPVREQLQLQIPSAKKETAVIEIQDMAGRLIRQENIQLSNALFSTALNVERLAKGVYQVVMIRDGKKETKTFIKE